jgi:hypothetical protein
MKHYQADDPALLDDLVRSRAYTLLREYLQQSLETARGELEKPADAEKTAGLRGEIKGLHQTIDAPAVLKREIRAELGRVKPQ